MEYYSSFTFVIIRVAKPEERVFTCWSDLMAKIIDLIHQA